MRIRRIAVAASAAATTAVAFGRSAPAEPAGAELDRRIEALRTKVALLEQRPAEDLAAAASRARVMEQLLRDAERRTELLATAGGASAGYDRGFFIRSGDWELRPDAQIQFRGVANHRRGPAGESDSEQGFEVRRMRFTLRGTAFTEDLAYRFTWSTRTRGGGLGLTDALVEYTVGGNWTVRLGQFKDPVHHEELVPSRHQVAAERTVLNETIGGGGINGRTQGVGVSYGNDLDREPVHLDFLLHDGAGEANTDFADDAFDFGVSGRVEWRLCGDWRDYKTFTALDTKATLAVLGLAGSWSQAGDGDLFTATADLHGETPSGLGLFAAALLAHVEGLGDSELPAGTSWGAVVQVAQAFGGSWEAFARADFVRFDADQPLAGGGTEDLFAEFTVGVNHFLRLGDAPPSFRAKATLDLTYLPDGVPADLVGPSTFGASGDRGEEEWVLRAQFQLVL